MSGKFGGLIQQARVEEKKREEVNQKTDKPVNQETVEPDVNLCVKVPLGLRRHWSAEAKRQGTTLTAVVIAALEAEFGMPG